VKETVDYERQLWVFPPPPIPEGVRAITDVEYAETPEKSLLLDIFLPAKLPPAPLPLIVNIHGGAG